MGNTAKQCRLGLFRDSDFAGDLEDSKSTSGGTLCIFGSHTFVPISWMCKKQTSVSHRSTESETMSSAQWTRASGGKSSRGPTHGGERAQDGLRRSHIIRDHSCTSQVGHCTLEPAGLVQRRDSMGRRTWVRRATPDGSPKRRLRKMNESERGKTRFLYLPLYLIGDVFVAVLTACLTPGHVSWSCLSSPGPSDLCGGFREGVCSRDILRSCEVHNCRLSFLRVSWTGWTGSRASAAVSGQGHTLCSLPRP